MKWKPKDSKEYRRRFALLPINIQGVWIWLEWYDSTGWYYDRSKCVDDFIKSKRYPSEL
jgi:hypothetical protein